MALNDRFNPAGMNPMAALGIGQMQGQRVAPGMGGPGTPLQVDQRGGGGMAHAPQLPQEQGGGNMAGAAGLIGLLGKQEQAPAMPESFNPAMTGEAGTPAGLYGVDPMTGQMPNSQFGQMGANPNNLNGLLGMPWMKG